MRRRGGVHPRPARPGRRLFPYGAGQGLTTSSFVTRFAPTPSGYLHRGHAFSALTAWRAAREAQGRFHLRIEDIDKVRCRPHFETAILEDLAWLGIDWEGPVLRQSQRGHAYVDALAALRDQGLLYRCFKTRREAAAEAARAPHGPVAPFRGEPLAPGEEARRLANKEPHAWRLSLAAALAAVAPDAPLTARIDGACVQVDLAAVGDPVLARKDVGVAYHLACVVDDAEQGVTHIIRGDDLRHAVPVQRLLQTLLGLPSPAYHHHELLLRPDGKRYAKRDAAETLRDLRARGETAKALVGALDQERLTRANGLGAQASEQRGGFFQGDEQSDGEGDAHAQPG